MATGVVACPALAGVRLSRVRLAAGVFVSQGVLHGLFALVNSPTGQRAPASRSTVEHGAQTLHDAHGAHGAAHGHPMSTATSADTGVSALAPESTMLVAHVLAAVLTYVLLRRGELFVEVLRQVLRRRPVFVLVSRPPVPYAPQVRTWTDAWHAPRLRPSWLGVGPWTLRGPPSVAR